jgi:hypothetical protein
MPPTTGESIVTEDSILMMVVALMVVVAIGATLALHLRRQRLLEFAVREREKTLARLSERFEGAAEFVEFARSPEAQILFATTDAPAAIVRRLLAMTGLGILLVALSVGMWTTVETVAPGADINLVNEARDARWWTAISASAGIGLLLAAAVCVRLARRWGIIGS